MSSGSPSGHGAWPVGLILVLAACSPSVSPTASGPPSSTATPQASPSGPTDITWHAIDQAWTTPLLAVASTGSEVIWSAGPDTGGAFAPDLYRLSVASGEIDVLVRSESRDSQLLPIAGSGAAYTWVELDPGEDFNRWTLWFLRAGDTEPVLIDAMDAGGAATNPPTIAISDDWQVWTSTHGGGAAATATLTALDLASMEKRTLQTAPSGELEFWFPDLDGDHLVYGTAQAGAPGGNPVSMVFWQDLAAWTQPVRLDTSGIAALPLISGDTVVWKEAALNPLDWGSLVRYSLATGTAEPLGFGDEERVNYPSMGDRYVAAWQWDPTRFYLVDLVAHEAVLVAEFPRSGRESDRRPHIEGNLVAWSHVPETGDLELRWAMLPE